MRCWTHHSNSELGSTIEEPGANQRQASDSFWSQHVCEFVNALPWTGYFLGGYFSRQSIFLHQLFITIPQKRLVKWFKFIQISNGILGPFIWADTHLSCWGRYPRARISWSKLTCDVKTTTCQWNNCSITVVETMVELVPKGISFSTKPLVVS